MVVERSDAHAGELTDLLDCRDRVPTFRKRTRRSIDEPRPGLFRLATPVAHHSTISNLNSVSSVRCRKHFPSSFAAEELSAARAPQRLRGSDTDELTSLRSFT